MHTYREAWYLAMDARLLHWYCTQLHVCMVNNRLDVDDRYSLLLKNYFHDVAWYNAMQ